MCGIRISAIGSVDISACARPRLSSYSQSYPGRTRYGGLAEQSDRPIIASHLHPIMRHYLPGSGALGPIEAIITMRGRDANEMQRIKRKAEGNIVGPFSSLACPGAMLILGAAYADMHADAGVCTPPLSGPASQPASKQAARAR